MNAPNTLMFAIILSVKTFELTNWKFVIALLIKWLLTPLQNHLAAQSLNCLLLEWDWSQEVPIRELTKVPLLHL